jgi:arginase family enzyme
MDLNDYFEPVSLEKPDDTFRFSDDMFGRNIRIHTPNSAIDEISNYQLAILGVPEDRNSGNAGSGEAPDRIRSALYELYKVNEKLRIIDLGNLRRPPLANDTYFGIRDVMLEMLNNQVTVIVLGGTQDITQGIYMAYELTREQVNVVTIDSRFDLEKGPVHSSSWMAHMLKGKKLLGCTVLGHQQYLVSRKDQEDLEGKSCDILRLGYLRSNISIAEPFIRDAHLVSIDIASVKQSDAPATRRTSPNGLLAEEICQLARYAGLSDHTTCFGVFEVNPAFDNHNQTANLTAQAVWYFIEGFSQRKREIPSQVNSDFKVFIVNHQDMEHALTFYKSLVTGRWWMEIPVIKTGRQVMVACSDEEYQQACKHDIPEMWWKAFQKLN